MYYLPKHGVEDLAASGKTLSERTCLEQGVPAISNSWADCESSLTALEVLLCQGKGREIRQFPPKISELGIPSKLHIITELVESLLVVLICLFLLVCLFVFPVKNNVRFSFKKIRKKEKEKHK